MVGSVDERREDEDDCSKNTKERRYDKTVCTSDRDLHAGGQTSGRATGLTVCRRQSLAYGGRWSVGR